MARGRSSGGTTYTYDRFFQQDDSHEYANWEASQPYIHYHAENARRAAGGISLEAIRAQALQSAKIKTIERFNKSVYSGTIDKTQLKNFSNEVKDMNESIKDSSVITSMLDKWVSQATDFGGSGTSAHDVAAKISTVIGSTMGSSKKRTIDSVDEVLTLMYDQNLDGLIQSLQSQEKLSSIKQDQLAALQKLQTLFLTDGKWGRGQKMSARNLLVDILTEQGLPDFLARCAESIGLVADSVIGEAFQYGKVKVAAGIQKGRSGKIDTMMTFFVPEGRNGTTKAIQQGISLKSNWMGFGASILSTSIRATLNYANQGNQYAAANAVSLMSDGDMIKAWMEWSNLDRALQGTMEALENGMQDRADLLIEFTKNGFEVHNINYLLYKLVQRIKALGTDTPLTKMGFGMSNRYGMEVVPYDRSKFDGQDIMTQIRNRSQYTASWLTQTHAITLDANALFGALQ